MTNTPPRGIYQHYKTQAFYEVIGSAIHSETREEMVIYKALYECTEYGLDQLWVRPKIMFMENVDHNGQSVPRFQWIKAASQA